MKRNQAFIIKNSDGLYFYGLVNYGKQINRAETFNKEEQADYAVEYVNNSLAFSHIKQDFKKVLIEIREI